MHPDSICVGVIDEPIRDRIVNFVFEVGAKLLPDRIGAMTVHQDAESVIVVCRSALRGENQHSQGQRSD
jgi:hypothetical protein